MNYIIKTVFGSIAGVCYSDSGAADLSQSRPTSAEIVNVNKDRGTTFSILS